MSRALRLVVTQSKCERLEIPNILQSYLKIHGVCAVVVFTKKIVWSTQKYQCKMSYDMSNRKRVSGSECSLFGLKADAKIVLSKILYRCDICIIGSQDSESKVRKISDQKLTWFRRFSKVTHSRKQWTEIESWKFTLVS